MRIKSQLRMRRLQQRLEDCNLQIEQEIARRKRMEEALHLTRFTLDQVADAIYWIDHEARFVDVNAAACQMLGYTRAELLSMSIIDINPVFSMAGWQGIWQRIHESGSFRLEGDHYGKDGRVIPVEVVANLIEFGGLELNCAFVRNISERKRMEEARRGQEQAEAASQAKSAFLAHMSHELRTPLNGILGYTQILQQQVHDQSTLDGLRVIRSSGEYLLTLINDILDLSKIEAGKFELIPTDVVLADFMQSMVSMIHSRAAAKSLDLVACIPPSIPRTVQVDEKCLRQVLLNLLSNAVKFTDSGNVSLMVETIEQAPPVPRRVQLRFSVSDTGVGIPADQLEQIFEPFVQLKATSRSIEGTGLGLAICRHLVHLLGSQLQVRSQPGQGSSFWFDLNLPISSDAPAAAVAFRQEIVGYQGPRRKVLVVDDQADNRLVLHELLEPLGFEVQTANNGAQALESALGWQPDVIMMDIMMPGQNGLEVTRDLRARGQTMAIVAVSASVLESEIQQTLHAGCNAFVPKPINLETLLEPLGELLRLTWIAATIAAPPHPSDSRPLPNTLLLPPQATLEELYRQARQGNLLIVYAQTRHMAEHDPRYQPFAAQIGELARVYEDEQLCALLSEYLGLVSG